MKAFGLEIRKSNSVELLFNNVDETLTRYNIPSKSINFDIQKQTVAHALQKMLKAESYFSVCTIDRCVKVAQIVISKERKDVYSAAHCLNWSDMLPDYREMLIAMILDDFREILNEI